jgi:hypothetical protein
MSANHWRAVTLRAELIKRLATPSLGPDLINWLSKASSPGMSQQQITMYVTGMIWGAQAALHRSVPYHWPSDACALLASSAASMPAWTFTPSDLPVASGFFAFAAPLPITPSPHFPEAQGIGALAWASGRRSTLRPGWVEAVDSPSAADAILLAAFAQGNEKLANALIALPMVVVDLQPGDTLSRVIARMDEAHAKSGPPPAEEHDNTRQSVQYFACALALLHQETCRSTPHGPPRAVRRRFDPQDLHDIGDVVNVVSVRPFGRTDLKTH